MKLCHDVAHGKAVTDAALSSDREASKHCSNKIPVYEIKHLPCRRPLLVLCPKSLEQVSRAYIPSFLKSRRLKMLAFVPFLLPVLALSLPHPFDDGLSKRCGPVSQFFRPTEADWTTARTDDFLNTWWTDHASEFDGHARDFSAAYGQWALGNPGWTCEINGADDDCDVNECDSRVLNDKGDQIQVAYYVVLGIRNLHTYFTGLRDSFEVSAIAAALAKDSFATTFYKDKDDKQVTALKEILNAVAMVVGIGAAAAGLGDGPEGAIASGISAIFSGAVGAVNPLLVDQ